MHLELYLLFPVPTIELFIHERKYYFLKMYVYSLLF